MNPELITVITKRSFEAVGAEVEKLEVFDGADSAIEDIDAYPPKAIVHLYFVDANPEAVAAAVARALGLTTFYYRITSVEVRRPRRN